MKNNFEALMPMIAAYVERHPKEYEEFLKEQKRNQEKQCKEDIDNKTASDSGGSSGQ